MVIETFLGSCSRSVAGKWCSVAQKAGFLGVGQQRATSRATRKKDTYIYIYQYFTYIYIYINVCL